ncbi:winged helix DNA-binding domain-containing protein [Actinomyces trachealis]|uniref:winged helix DNA-binding domain-containing protein n=1 Tax=Actinomyces trachealis TaxID=2763540 RepID=UPI0018C4EBC4|nr:winged helix DNA-binding domain-containing protein [Actinomyces trachealis]
MSRPTPALSAASVGGTPLDVSLLRIVAQGLVPSTSASDVAEAVRRQLAVQGQQVSAVPHALLSRTTGTRMPDVERAFADGQLVRSWPMRGTVHITTAEDHHWLREALVHRYQNNVSSGTSWLGLTEADVDRAGETALALIAEEGPLPRARLISAWEEAGLLGSGDGPDSSEVVSGRRRHLIARLHWQGVLVQGPRSANEHLVVDARALPGAATGPGGSGGSARGSDGHRAALAEIARRYATSHGPVTAADLARWTTLPVGQAAQALEDAVAMTNAVDYATVEPSAAARGFVSLTRGRVGEGPRGGLTVTGAGSSAAPSARERATTFYLRADLPDLLADSWRQARATLFLASFDELHVGYKDRSCLTDEVGERLICPGKNGMFRPLLVDRGRVVAVRPVGQGLIWDPSVRRSARLEADVERAVRRMERRLAGRA